MTPAALFSEQARTDLDDAIGWLLDHGSSAVAAERLLAAVLDAAGRLARRPQLGHRRPDLLPDRFRVWSIPRHRLVPVYAAEAAGPVILRVLSTDRNLAPLPAGIAEPSGEP